MRWVLLVTATLAAIDPTGGVARENGPSEPMAGQNTPVVLAPAVGETAYQIAGQTFAVLWEQVTASRPAVRSTAADVAVLPSGDVVRYVYQPELAAYWQWVFQQLGGTAPKAWRRPAELAAKAQVIRDAFYNKPLAAMAPHDARGPQPLAQAVRRLAQLVEESLASLSIHTTIIYGSRVGAPP